MSTQGKLHNHELIIHLETDEDIARNDGTHEMFARMAEENTAYRSTLDLQISRARELVKRWNAFEKGGSYKDLVRACEKALPYISELESERESNTLLDILRAIQAALIAAE